MSQSKKPLFIILCLCLLVSFGPQAQADEDKIRTIALEVRQALSVKEPNQQAIELQDEDSGLEDYKSVARVIFEVQKNITDRYALADGLSLSAYILKTFSEIGDYELQRNEILELVNVFERLTEIQTTPEVKDIIQALDKLVFSKRNDKLSVVFHTRNPRGFRLQIYREDDAPKDESFDIEHFHIYDQAQINFAAILGHVQREELIDFFKQDYKWPLLPTKWFSRLNQIHPEAPRFIDSYLKQKRGAVPLKLDMSGFELRVATSTLFNRIDFEIKGAFTTPGLISTELIETQDGVEVFAPLPSFHLWMQEKLLRVKASVQD